MLRTAKGADLRLPLGTVLFDVQGMRKSAVIIGDARMQNDGTSCHSDAPHRRTAYETVSGEG